MTSIPEHVWQLARGPEGEIDYLALSYPEWLALQHAWMLDRLGLSEQEPLAVALRALDAIARKPLNADQNDKYWLARYALEATGGWSREADDDVERAPEGR